MPFVQSENTMRELPINVYCETSEGKKLIARVANVNDVKLFFKPYMDQITWNMDVPDEMTFEKFSKACDRTWHGTPPSMGEGQELSFLGLAINGEAGELAEHIKKLYRDDNGILTPERRQLLLKELGDKLFYMDRAAKFLGSSLDEVAEINVEKLADRTRRGVRGGSGDNR